jgi:hypothetical protein
MSLFRNTLLALACVLAGTVVVSAAVLHVAGGGDVKPPDPNFVYFRTGFDCTPLQVINLNIGTPGTRIDDTTGGTNLIDGYPCAPWAEKGPEHIYQLEVSAGDTLEFWAGLRNISPDVDHDLFLLNGCDTDSCLIGDSTEFTVILTEGTYLLIVDGASGGAAAAEGPYTLEYTCRYVGVSPIACFPGFAQEVVLVPGDTPFNGNLFGQADFVRSYECSPIPLKGGEKWYTLTLPAPTGNQWGGQNTSEFTAEITVIAPTLDVALWLFDGCGINPVCLDHVNDSIGGNSESLTFRNETDQEVTVFLAVDCFREPTESGTGYFSILFTPNTVVETEKTSFGSLRSLYR